jgi:hypothetical protein
MLSTDSLFVGIDTASTQKSFTYAALDKGLNLVALADADLEELAAFLAGQRAATVAVNAPSGVNRGLVREKIKREMLTPQKVRAAEYRVAEVELRERGIAVTGTPASAALSPAWMQAGFALYRKLANTGFKKFPSSGESFQMLETHPHACYCALAGSVPLSKLSLEGKIQRQLLLYENGVRIRDPMELFEEITRYKLMKGLLPLDMLYSPEQLDALVAAFTAWLAANKPEKTCMVGDAREGLIVLPEAALKEKY